MDGKAIYSGEHTRRGLAGFRKIGDAPDLAEQDCICTVLAFESGKTYPMRHLKASLIVGLISSLLVVWLRAADLFHPLDQALAQFLSPNLSKIPFDPFAMGGLLVFCAFGIAWITVDLVRFSLKCVVVISAFVLVFSLPWVLSLYQIFFSPFAPATTILFSFLLASLYSQSGTGRRKQILSHLFGARISQSTFDALLNSDVPLNFNGAVCEASILVCEIFNHDELMEALSPADYVALNNLFLSVSADFLVEKKAYIDECDGESLRVIFGAPLPDSQHAVHACKTALGLVKRLDILNFECKMKWKKTFDYRIGVNSGEMVGAAFGSQQLGAYSMSGQAVDFARRLCEGNIGYGSTVLIGAGTQTLASNAIEVRPMELIRLRDQRTVVEIYELLAEGNALSENERTCRDHFWKGVIYYRENRLNDALNSFRAAVNPDRQDLPLDHYISRIENLRSLESEGDGRGA